MTGLNLKLEEEQQQPTDYIFGATSVPCLASIPLEARYDYLPIGEIQNKGSEKNDCATRSPLNILETKFNYLLDRGELKNVQWLKDNGYIEDGRIVFSDRFVAINSGTTASGNSLKAPLHAIHKQGLIPKSMFPQTWSLEEYYSGITDKMRKLGEEFTKRFTINYEKVYEKDFETILRTDLIGVAGFAWSRPINGEYPKVDYQPNHAFMIFNLPKTYAFDNYEA